MDDEVGGIDGMTAIQMTSGQRGKILAEIELKNDNIKAVYELQYVKEIFQKFDADNSKSIDAMEFQRLCNSLGYEFATRSEVEKAVAMLDDDNSGTIEWEEFRKWWQSNDKFADFVHLLDDSAFLRDELFMQGKGPAEAEEVEDTLPPMVIHPYQSAKSIWDATTAIYIVYSAIFVPYRMAFNIEVSGGALIFDKFVDCAFLIDIVLTFRTAYFDENDVLISDPAVIRKTYLGGWFVPDFLSSFPFDSVALLFIDDDDAGSMRMLKMIRMLRLLKIMRMVRMSRLLDKFQDAMSVKSGVMISVKFGFYAAVCAHYLACIFFVIAEADEFPGVVCRQRGTGIPGLTLHVGTGDCPVNSTQPWVVHKPMSTWVWRYFSSIEVNGDKKEWRGDAVSYEDPDAWTPVTRSNIYWAAFYWSITTMSTLGYGEINASDTTERLFVMIAIAVGCVIFAYGITNMCTLVANLDVQAVFAQNRSDEMIEWLNTVHASAIQKKKVMQYFTYLTSYSTVYFFEREVLLSELSSCLRNEVLLHALGPVLEWCPLFKDADIDMKYHLLNILKPEVFCPSEFLVEEGMFVRGCYFVSHGSADLSENGETLRRLGWGEVYGDFILQYDHLDVPRTRATQSLIAVGYLDVYIIHTVKFDHLMNQMRRVGKDAFDFSLTEDKSVQIPMPEAEEVAFTPQELKLRNLRLECADQEDMIAQLLESLDRLDKHDDGVSIASDGTATLKMGVA